MYEASRVARIEGFFVQAEDGIRDLVRSRGLGDVYKRQLYALAPEMPEMAALFNQGRLAIQLNVGPLVVPLTLSLIHI